MERSLTAFLGDRRLAAGTEAVLRPILAALGDGAQQAQIFDTATGRPVDIDLRAPGDPAEEDAGSGGAQRGRGRPRLGVRAREVTLLPRHWDWLARQRGGTSAALRQLIDAALRREADNPPPRVAMDAAYHFLTAMAGDRPGYEEAMRALYAGRAADFHAATEGWPQDVRDHGRRLAAPAFAAPGATEAATDAP